jgi:hypothetical protein
MSITVYYLYITKMKKGGNKMLSYLKKLMQYAITKENIETLQNAPIF